MRAVCLLWLAAAPLFAAPRTLFYLTSSPASVKSFLANIDRIDIVGPQTYYTDERGLVWGGVDPAVLEAARQHKVAVMPLVVNPGFSQEIVHKLLASPEARRRMIGMLVDECRRHGYAGFQFDFENVRFDYAGQLVTLTSEAYAEFHKHGLQLSVAAVPRPSEYPGGNPYSHWMYTNWRGAFDLAELAKVTDFVSLMTYDEHTRHTPPGPIAGMPWVETIMKYALERMPKEKLSLGIPLYGRRWHAGMKEKEPAIVVSGVTGTEAADLAAAFHVTPQWDPVDKAPWFFFYRDLLREYVFWTDRRSFEERWKLVAGNGLHGISCWALGQEDPAVWGALPRR
jgi:spore germination protein YaaH